MQHLLSLGLTPTFLAQLDPSDLDDPPLGRVCFEAHGHLRLLTLAGERAAILHPHLDDPRDRVVVGDWVLFDRRWDPLVVTRRLDRASVLRRRDPDPNLPPQVVAANLDTALICTALGPDFSVRRLERWLLVVGEAGVEPVVVLTKADRGADVDGALAEVRRVARDVPVLPVSALDDVGVDGVREVLRPGRTAALLGSSGVGKSTLANLLLAREVLDTGEIRAHDGRGRHTTTARHLFRLESGAWLLDNPGVRSVGLVDGADLDEVFADLAAIAATCRFRDCGHDGEPGCAVAAAIEAGELDPDRFDAWRKLERELAHEARRTDKLAARAERQKWKAIHKAQRARDRLR